MRPSVVIPLLLLVGVIVLAVIVAPRAEAVPRCKEGECQTCMIAGKRGTRCCDGGQLSACVPLDGTEPEVCAGKFCTGNKICQNKVCVCPDGFTDCGGICRNLAIDSSHCGDCNNACPVGTSCQPPSLSPATAVGLPGSASTPALKPACTCLAPTVSCGGVCRNFTDDPANCGGCGHACTAPTAACRKGQCAPPEAPTNSPSAGGTGNLPLDLFWTTTDPNGLPFNADWRARSDDALVESNHVDLAKACPACNPDLKCLQRCGGVGGGGFNCALCMPPESCWQRCTSFPLMFDNGHLCGKGHANWMPATYDGTLAFDDYSARGLLSSLVQDDDYTFNLTPTGGAGLAGRNTLHSEMAFLETVDRFHSPFWENLHRLVDRVPGDDLSGPRSVFGKYAIVIGLLGFDLQHGAHAELHPIYAMALHTSDNPRHDCWAIFARNWGNEGFCSNHEHFSRLSQITFRLPRPGATAVTEISRSFRTNNSATAVSDVGLVQDGAEISFALGQPDQETHINGEICLRWAVPAEARPIPLVAAATDLAPIEVDDDRHPGIALLTPAQLAELNKSLPARKARNRNLDMLEPKRMTSVARRAPTGVGTVVVPDRAGPADVQKQAVAQQIHRRVCDMLRGNPRRPKICDQP